MHSIISKEKIVFIEFQLMNELMRNLKELK